MEIEAYKALDRLIEEAIGDDDVYGLTGPGKGISARECDVALDAMLIRGRLHVSSWRITKELDQSINQALIDAENRRKDIRPLCRAFFKMEEAILRFRLSEFITSASMVVDVGCAPGGWIQALGDEMKRNSETGDDSGIIFAVDPARLGFKPPKTVEPPVNLVHLQKKIEESIDDIHDKLNGEKLSLVACDGNSSPMAVYRWVAPLLSMVDETKGALVLTMKNFVAGKRVFYEAIEELAQKLKSEHQFEETHLVPLFSNSTEEMTLVAFRKKRTTTR
jgi:23S rRNA U2552 (ribose-2'-O)-methylase RlmE/FtsJ